MNNIRVMSFNIRGSFDTWDNVNAWDKRAALNVETIKCHAPDVIGFQELQSGNLKTYRQQLLSTTTCSVRKAAIMSLTTTIPFIGSARGSN